MTTQNQRQDDEFLLSQYLDGQLPVRQVRRLEQRLGEDPRLREQLRLYASLEGRLSELAERTPSADFSGQRADIMASLERKVLLNDRPGQGRTRRIVVWPALAAAAALLVLATVAYFYANGLATRNPAIAEANLVQPFQPDQDEPEQLALQIRRLEWEEIPLSAVEDAVPPSGGAPSGTVMVSVGGVEGDRPSADPVPFAIH